MRTFLSLTFHKKILGQKNTVFDPPSKNHQKWCFSWFWAFFHFFTNLQKLKKWEKSQKTSKITVFDHFFTFFHFYKIEKMHENMKNHNFFYVKHDFINFGSIFRISVPKRGVGEPKSQKIVIFAIFVEREAGVFRLKKIGGFVGTLRE